MNLAAVITDGFTNSRLDVYELDTMRRLERREGWNWSSQLIVGKDGRLWFDIPDAVEHLMYGLKDFEHVEDISIIVPVARGGTCAMLDTKGALLPGEVEDISGEVRHGGVISYINATSAESDAIFDAYASPLERYMAYGLPPNFTGCTVPGRTVLSLANEHPEQLRGAGAFVFGPEIMARLACAGAPSPGHEGLELSYVMCHTGLWKDGGWSQLARAVDDLVAERTGRRLIGDLMPEVPGWSSQVFDCAGKRAADEYGVDQNAAVLKGVHDSTVADLPVIAAFRHIFGVRDFIHFQAGSWGMARLIRKGGSPAPPEDGFGKNVMYQGDISGNPVLTASAPTGIEFQHYAGTGPAGRGMLLQELGLDRLATGDFEMTSLEGVLAQREIFITPGVAAGVGPFPQSTSEVFGMEKIRADRSGELAYIALNLQTAIMATASIEVVSGSDEGMTVVLSAGAAADPLFRLLVASLNPSREVYFVADARGGAVTETTSDGGFLLALEHNGGVPALQTDVTDLGYFLEEVAPERSLGQPLADYREEFEKRVG